MKKIHIIILLFCFSFCLWACEKDGPIDNPKNEIAEKDVSGSAISGPAIKPNLNDSQANELVENIIKNMSLEEKIGQLLMVKLSSLDEDENGTNLSEVMKRKIRDYHIGAIILEKQNMINSKQVRGLCDEINKCSSGPAINIAVKEDGGGTISAISELADYKNIKRKNPMEMSKTMDQEGLEESAGYLALILKKMGIDTILGPVADVSKNPETEYGKRCFGTDSQKVKGLISSFVKGMVKNDISPSLEYFPGMDGAIGDHTKILLENRNSLATLRDEIFNIYQAGIDSGASRIMIGDVIVKRIVGEDKIPAFMSSDIVTSLLREEMGYSKLVLTPELDTEILCKKYSDEHMAEQAILAGCDIIVAPAKMENVYNTILQDVKIGKIDEALIDASVSRVLIEKL